MNEPNQRAIGSCQQDRHTNLLAGLYKCEFLLSSYVHLIFLKESSTTCVKNYKRPGLLTYYLFEPPIMFHILVTSCSHGFSNRRTDFVIPLLFLWQLIANILSLLQAVCKSQIICTILGSLRLSLNIPWHNHSCNIFFPQGNTNNIPWHRNLSVSNSKHV